MMSNRVRSTKRPQLWAGLFRLWPGVLVALGLIVSTGCANRYRLVPKELSKVQTEVSLSPLRVYPHVRLVSKYEAEDKFQSYDVSKKIEQTSRGRDKREVIKRNTPGLILQIDELNGMPLLWVTFEPSCREPKCAYGFVQNEDDRYRLIHVPDIDGYKKPKNYRFCVWKKRRLKRGKRRTLSEPNDIYLVRKKLGRKRVLTVMLEVKKKIRRTKRSRTRVKPGVQ